MAVVSLDTGRTKTILILSGAGESDILDLGGIQKVLGTGVAVNAGSSTTTVVTSALSPSGANDKLEGNIICFRSNTTTAALRNQQRAITGSTAEGVLTVVALTNTPADGDVFDIFDVDQAKSYRRFDGTVWNQNAALTGTVTIQISNISTGNFATLQSGGSDITFPVQRATPLVPFIARFAKFKSSGTEAADRTFNLMLSTISIGR